MPEIDEDEYLEIRHELEGMMHSELVAEVITRIKSQRQMLIDNWHDNKKLRQEVQESRSFITNTADQIERWEKDVAIVVAKGLYWKKSFYVLLSLMVTTLALSFLDLHLL